MTSEEVKALVVFRLETLPEGKKISIGSKGDFSKEDLISHVRADDAIGKKIVEIELEFLRAMKGGLIS